MDRIPYHCFYRIRSKRVLLFLATILLLGPSLGTGFRWELPSSSLLCLRGGARPHPQDSYHDDDPRRRRPSPKTKTSSLLKRVAKGSAKLTGQALSVTARTSGKMAYSLVSPKHVVWKELVGLWRLDQWMNDEDRSLQSTIELTPRPGQIIIPGKRGMIDGHFTPSKWPRSARIEFTHPADQLIYSCTIHRKLADTKVLKLRGKIYARKWGRKVIVGTFVGRRRLKLLQEEEDDDDQDFLDDEDESEFDPDEASDTDEAGAWDILQDARSTMKESKEVEEYDNEEDEQPYSTDDENDF